MPERPSTVPRRLAAAVAAVALLTVPTACSSSASSSARSAGPTSSTAGTSSTDSTACLQVQKVFLQLAGLTARWDPGSDPFNASTAKALGPLAHQLREQSRSAAAPRLRVAFERSANALEDLQAAMKSGRRPAVASAVTRTRTAYAALPGCARRGGHRAHDAQPADTSPATGHTGQSSGPTSGRTSTQAGGETGVVKGAATDPGCVGAKAVYAKLGAITAGWKFDSDPFDPGIAAGFRSTAAGLHAAASTAKSRKVADEVEANGEAFQKLADTMATKDLNAVDDGVVYMQRTASTLAATCPLS